MAGVALLIHLFSALQLQVDIIGRRLPKSAANQDTKHSYGVHGSINLTASARGLAWNCKLKKRFGDNVAKLNTNSPTGST